MVVTEAGIVTVVSLFLANALLPMVCSDEARLKSIAVRPRFSSSPRPDVAAGIDVTDGATVSVLVMTFPAASLVMVIVPIATEIVSPSSDPPFELLKRSHPPHNCHYINYYEEITNVSFLRMQYIGVHDPSLHGFNIRFYRTLRQVYPVLYLSSRTGSAFTPESRS